LVPVTTTVHGYLMVNAPDDVSRQIQPARHYLFTQLGVRSGHSEG